MFTRLGAWAPIVCLLLHPTFAVPMRAETSAVQSGPGKPAPASPDDRLQRVARPDWGRIQGWVLDAETRRPIAGAAVAVEVDGTFPAAGKSTDLTEADGKFAAKAPLGKISSKFDWGRLLTMHPISILISPRSVTKQTKILDVTQVNVRVEAPGYRRFLGSVRATRMDPGDFSITLDDVWLSPAGSASASFTPGHLRWEVIEGLTVEPPIAAPGDKVKVTLRTELPVGRGFKYRAYVTSSAARLIDNQAELKRVDEKPAGKKAAKAAKGATSTTLQEKVTFVREFKLPKNSQDTWTELSFFLVRNGGTMLKHRDTRMLLQVVRTPEERGAAERVANGFAYALAGSYDQAVTEYTAAATALPTYPLTHLLLGDLHNQAGKSQAAETAYKRLVDLDPRDYELGRPRYAHALLNNGKADEALTVLAGAEQALGKSARIPAHVFQERARGFARKGDFLKVDENLARAGEELEIPQEVLNEINLRRLEDAVRKRYQEPELRMSLARQLLAVGRREEAITHLRRATTLDLTQPWAFLDLGAALWESGRREEGLANLKHALSLSPDNSLAQLAVADALRDLGRYSEALPLYQKVASAQTLNLRARHNYALMLYATGSLAEARREFVLVVSQAREKGDLREDGLPIPGMGIYFGPKRRLVSGFSIPEAAADAALLEALEDLERNPENALLWQNVGRALLDLNLPVLAAPALQRSLKSDPELVETRYLLAVAHQQSERTGEARKELEAVLAANPLHPRARLDLAQLLTEAGDLDRAQAQLAAHRKNYPFDPTKPTRR